MIECIYCHREAMPDGLCCADCKLDGTHTEACESRQPKGDETEGLRRALVPMMPTALEIERLTGRPVWDTAQMTEEFTALGFAAPFVLVRRKADGVTGSLMFTHNPRWYFNFTEDIG